MWRSAQKYWQNLAEFNTVHIVGPKKFVSPFFSGASIEICYIPVKFFMAIAKIFHNPSKANYVDLSSNTASIESILVQNHVTWPVA